MPRGSDNVNEIPSWDQIKHERERWVQRPEREILALQLERLFSGWCSGKCLVHATVSHCAAEALGFHYLGPFSSHIYEEDQIKISSLSGRQPSTQLGLAPETGLRPIFKPQLGVTLSNQGKVSLLMVGGWN